MKNPKITVITPSFNQGEFLEDTITSVLDQAYPNLEYFIFDGGSTDNSVDIIKKYEKHLDFWVSEKDKGQTDAINKGIKRATGDIIAWLNSDDFYYPGALKVVAQAYLAHPQAGLYVGNGTLTDKEGRKIRTYSNGVGFDFETLLQGSNFILQPSTFMNRRIFDEVGLLDESLDYAMDLEFWLRVGKEYPVVTIDRELSAYRWYDDIKNTTGGFARWVEQWQVMRRYSDAQITPGLLVELFKVLQEPGILKTLQIDGLEQIAQKSWHTFYNIMQQKLQTRDCIPVRGSDIKFEPDESASEPEADTRTAAPPVVSWTGSNPKVDIVLPMGHSWFVRGGYVQALKHFSSFGQAFHVSEKQGVKELFDYLKSPACDLMFLMNTDWHAQYLHDSAEWRRRWRANKVPKVLFSFESMNNPVVQQNARWWQDNLTAVNNAMPCVDAVVFAHEIDAELFSTYGVPQLWQPFAIDEEIFPEPKDYAKRKKRAFFRGKATPFYYEETYRSRRRLMKSLQKHRRVDIFDGYDYDDYQEHDLQTLGKNQRFISEMNEYQAVLSLPSLSPTLVVRPFEGMAAGCVVFQNHIRGEKSRHLFEDGKHLIFYDENDPEALGKQITALLRDPDLGRQIAENGYEEVLNKHTIKHRVLDVFDWLQRLSLQPEQPSPRDETLPVRKSIQPEKAGKILIDGVIFDLQRENPAGISRVWETLLHELAGSAIADRILLLDRNGTAPDIPGLQRRLIREYKYMVFEDDSLYLQEICEEENAALFVSTYFTYPENAHCAVMLHDMIPELWGMDLSQAEWRAKAKAIEKAKAYLAVSESTKSDFQKIYPQFKERPVFVTHNAAGDVFHPRSQEEITEFREKYGIRKPYFVLSGKRLLYKNAIQFFKAFALLENKTDYEILCTGGGRELENIFKPFVQGVACHVHFLSDEELSVAYAGALALVYPSLYEGFGLPVLEAMQSGCPVIACKNSSIPEVAGDAALYVAESDVEAMCQALVTVQKTGVRTGLVEKGRENAARFSWTQAAQKIVHALQKMLEYVQDQPQNASDPLFTAGRLFYVLEKENKDPDLISAMAYQRSLYHGTTVFEHAELERTEGIIARMPDRVFEVMQQEFYGDFECDALFCYWFGLALSERRKYPEATDAFIKAFERGIGYRWRSAFLAACAACEANNLPAAYKLLKDVVLLDFPKYKPAVQKLAAVTERYKSARENHSTEQNIAPGSQKTAAVQPVSPQTPLVSAIVSTYKSERFLRGCLEDLEAQTIAEHLEIIVVDSGSPENEREIVAEFQKKYDNIRYIRTEEREGIYAAWNRGIKVARGKYLTNANTDDRHRCDALELMTDILEARPDIALVYANVYITQTENETFEQHTRVGTFRWYDFDRIRLIDGCYIGPQPMWRRSLHEKYGFFDESYESAGDWEFWLRMAMYETFYHIDEYLGLYLQSPDSAEHRDPELSVREAQTIQQKYLPYKRNYLHEQFHEAKKLIQQDKLVEGLELLSRLLDHDPAHFETLCLVGDLYQRLGEDGKARQMWTLALRQQPGNVELQSKLQALELESGESIEALYARGNDLIQQGKLVEGLRALSRLLDVQPNHKATLRLMSEVYDRLGKHRESEEMRQLAESL